MTDTNSKAQVTDAEIAHEFTEWSASGHWLTKSPNAAFHAGYLAALAAQEKPEPGEAVLDVDRLAQEIRRVDGNHSLGAGALAEALMPFLSPALVSTQARTGEPAAWALIHAGDIVETTFKSDDAEYMREVNPNCSVVPLYLHPAPSPDLQEGEVETDTMQIGAAISTRYHASSVPLDLASMIADALTFDRKRRTSPSPIDKGEVK